MYNRVQTLSANTNTGDTMHHHTFVQRRPAHVIDLFGNLFNPSPPTPSWSLVTNPDPTAQAKLRINRNEYALATSCTPDPDDNVYRTADHLSRTLGITHLEAVDTTDTDYTVFQITLPTDEAIGATRIIDAIATAHNTSRATAFTELLHGTAGEVKVTLNCYRNLDTGDMHLENHKLTGIAPGTWMRRVTDLTVPSHSTHHGRFATEAQKALIAGIDGTCRAPGCDNPAATADADHIHRYDNNPHTGTREMQSLCRRCHILKTLGLTDYTRLTDGTTIVSSIDDNHTVTTVPTGPLAHANLTFDRRLARKTRTRKEHQKLRDTWNYITRFAFQNVGASAIIVEEAPTPSS
ncbi:HNH endonuclease signature motif containing protein [Corynebacterium variabile]|uniref:HNH endonuclease signature motif containing protein n=1 Tax=Corynebacterium variabile TaxID=1727 RepID=UPI0028AC52BF|nr:HNH endonuclease signature motif containing protein [Corynebacterium variabile]